MREAGKPRRSTRPIDRVLHIKDDIHAVDATIDRRFPHRALRRRIQEATQQLQDALGPQSRLWLQLEEALNELRGSREDEYFDLGYEHGFAAGRADCMRAAPDAFRLAAQLRDLAIQDGCPREKALAALLEAAWSLLGQKSKVSATKR